EVVAIKTSSAGVLRRVGKLPRAERGALQHQDVVLAVVVVVEERNARAGYLGEVVLAAHAVEMGELNARCLGDVGERFGRVRSGRRRSIARIAAARGQRQCQREAGEQAASRMVRAAIAHRLQGELYGERRNANAATR